MVSQNSRWKRWLQNLGWYLITMVALIIFLRFRAAVTVVLPALWLVGIVWGAVLTYQFTQLLFGAAGITVHKTQLQDYLDQTRTYKKQIEQAIKNTSGPASRLHLDTLQQQIEAWTTSIESLVARLDHLSQDKILQRDWNQVPKAIADLEQRLAKETDPAIQTQLQDTLDNRQKQLAALEHLQNTSKRAEIQIENTLSRLGTIYSQILTGQSTHDVADYQHLSTDIDEEVRRLEDHLSALEEVKFGQN